MAQGSLPTGWWAVQWSDHLAAGEIERVRLGPHDIIAYRGHSGRAYAADSVSPDRGFPLTVAEVVGDSLRSRIDGKVWPPGHGESTDSRHPQLIHYPVSERAGLILVGVGDDISGSAPDLAQGVSQWRPISESRTWEGSGSPLIALENLCDPTSLGYLLAASVVEGPSVVSHQPDDLHLSYRVDDSTSQRTVDVCARSPGLMWVGEPGRGGAFFAVTPRSESGVTVRCCIDAAVDGDGNMFDWRGCVDRQIKLLGLIRHVPGLNLNDDERCGLDAARHWVGAN
jgi:hypothetical protein